MAKKPNFGTKRTRSIQQKAISSELNVVKLQRLQYDTSTGPSDVDKENQAPVSTTTKRKATQEERNLKRKVIRREKQSRELQGEVIQAKTQADSAILRITQVEAVNTTLIACAKATQEKILVLKKQNEARRKRISRYPAQIA
ncbi:hypothetical protein M422DRAFT_266508 [Sphaerobolus stellatus SS14]|uniref:No apical meristem-associated C-terminal domain-containing protein n=1 Tax=Sphaerobolus stellatus (strain SS14) TaxID=990650 RepID=A0A0C9V2I9_SPHS4|nr:hypothetical protein M422DRAFT_266508 [Sphaerobolus stellatus SS14]